VNGLCALTLARGLIYRPQSVGARETHYVGESWSVRGPTRDRLRRREQDGGQSVQLDQPHIANSSSTRLIVSLQHPLKVMPAVNVVGVTNFEVPEKALRVLLTGYGVGHCMHFPVACPYSCSLPS
jgi:hypothetical protein